MNKIKTTLTGLLLQLTALKFLSDNILVRFGDTVHRKSIGIPLGIKCAPGIADLFLYCCEQLMDRISQLVRVACICNNVSDCNVRNITEKVLH